MTATKTAYAKDENGNMVETNASIKRRIADAFGFQPGRIVLMEASYRSFEGPKGKTHCYCDQVSFQVNGKGYSTGHFFDELLMNPAYDA